MQALANKKRDGASNALILKLNPKNFCVKAKRKGKANKSAQWRKELFWMARQKKAEHKNKIKIKALEAPLMFKALAQKQKIKIGFKKSKWRFIFLKNLALTVENCINGVVNHFRRYFIHATMRRGTILNF